MVVDERSRHELYRRLEEVLGPEAATTLIEHLPPVGGADVATKHDLASLKERIELRFDRIDGRLTRVDDRFAQVEDRFERLDELFGRIDDRFATFDENLGFRFGALESGLRASFEHELRAQAITLFIALVTLVLAMAAPAFSLVRFT